MIGNTYLGLKLFKNLFQKFSTTTKFTMKVKTSKNALINIFTTAFNLIVLNTTNLSNSYHGQNSLKDTIFSVLIFGVKLFLTS